MNLASKLDGVERGENVVVMLYEDNVFSIGGGSTCLCVLQHHELEAD